MVKGDKRLEWAQDDEKQNEFLKDSEALMEATRTIVQSTLDAKEIISRVMEAARRLLCADRATLWLLDKATDELWAEIPFADGSMHQIRLPVGQGFIGQAAVTGQVLNVPFDLYEHPDAATAKQTDQKSGYRTYSLFCLPVWSPDGELLGVTQLLNKRRSGDDLATSAPNDELAAPDCFQDSFDANSQKYLEIFNAQVGVALHNAQQLERVKPQDTLAKTEV